LFEKLRQLRLSIARELGVPPFVVFHDKTLIEMAALKPTTIGDFLQISGVGETKADKYGEQFMAAIRESGDEA
jgi:ATP-dependent DNA helicase RecQ